MALSAGTKLGPYEIQAPLGAGGMGEVYLATQSSLGRQVAVKVLCPAFASDPERLRRFEQEARAASALNHPNIISIYDVGRDAATAYIAMEFVDGKTLRSLLEAGPMAIKKTLQIGAQIGDGLAKAHAAGIVHRDLKPENIMVTRDGFVKILDFGLAKLMPSLDSSSDSSSQTLTKPLPGTHPGMVMGTAGYMSPEQARGTDVDYRSDIFSLGAILYEMVAGKKAFQGPSSAQTLAAIIEDNPQSLAEVSPKAPTPLRWIIERCLAKEPDDRYTATRDLARDLQSIRDHLSDASTSTFSAQAAPAPFRPKWMNPALFALAGVVLGGALTAVLLPRPVAESVTLHSLTFSGDDREPSVSPDGRTVAFASGRDGKVRIWLKQLESGSETALTPGPLDHHPRFSPDNAWVLYIHGHAAYRVPSLGGEPRKLLDNVDDANWSPDGSQLVFTRVVHDGTKITTEAGTASVADGTSRVAHRFEDRELAEPSWSPDGSTIVLTEKRGGTVGSALRTVTLLDLAGQSVRDLECPLPGGALSAAAWSGDGRSIVYEVPESPADVSGVLGSTLGSPGRVLLQDVKTGKARTLFTTQAPGSRVDIAGLGRIIYDLAATRGNLREIPLDPAYGEAARWLTRGSSIDRQPYYSPDGESVVFSSSRSGNADLWEVSTETNSVRRLTDHPALDWDPFVTADGKNLLWSSNRSGHFEIWMADPDGSAPRQISHDGSDAENPVAVPGGWVVYASSQAAHPGLWKMRPDGSEAMLLVPGTVAWPDISASGQYVLYHILNGVLSATIRVVRLSDGAPVEFGQEGTRGKFAGDGHSILFIDNKNGGGIVRAEFPSAYGAPVKVLVPAYPDMETETFDVTRDGRRLVVAYQQITRSLVVADGVPEVKPATRTK
jgi:eukaryotic-like serine/threonine-protein kinase